MQTDAVDAIVERWARERPDLDTSAKGITGRLVRLAGLCHDAFDEASAPLGIVGGEFGLLAALRRAGEPYELTPTELSRLMMMTSGGMTAALDRMEKKGFITRAPNPKDRRGSLVRLTAEGRKVIEKAMDQHADVELDLVRGLTVPEREKLIVLLRKMLVALEPAAGS